MDPSAPARARPASRAAGTGRASRLWGDRGRRTPETIEVAARQLCRLMRTPRLHGRDDALVLVVRGESRPGLPEVQRFEAPGLDQQRLDRGDEIRIVGHA